MKEDAFDFDVIARGNFIDTGTGGDIFRIEAITLRLNHIAYNEYLSFESFNPPECYSTDVEWEQRKAEKQQARIAWKKAVVDRLGLYGEKGAADVTITEAMSEVFTVVFMERLS
jgi:hypothetical protein